MPENVSHYNLIYKFLDYISSLFLFGYFQPTNLIMLSQYTLHPIYQKYLTKVPLAAASSSFRSPLNLLSYCCMSE